ncbi:MAG: hypothetical protein WKF89_17120, partial [Chitinophagaceae bacterium]
LPGKHVQTRHKSFAGNAGYSTMPYYINNSFITRRNTCARVPYCARQNWRNPNRASVPTGS